MADRHHLLYGSAAPEATDAPFETPGGLLVCLSCHDVDACTKQILIERDCRICHLKGQELHHVLYGTKIPDPTDAPHGTSGGPLVCLSCHDIDINTDDIQFPVERNCRVCHQPNENEPVAVDDFFGVADGSLLRVPVPGVLYNDRDTDGDPLAAILVSNVSSGELKLLPGGAFMYRPEPDFVGEDSFTYVAHDGLHGSDVARVTISAVGTDIKIVGVDVKPGSDRNLVSLCSMLPVTIQGSADCDATEIDVSSLLLERQVAPLLWKLEDEGDGYPDLKLEFDIRALSTLRGLRIGQMREVWITGALIDGTPIMGRDFIVVASSSRLDEDGEGL